jgi:hypothetical protein
MEVTETRSVPEVGLRKLASEFTTISVGSSLCLYCIREISGLVPGGSCQDLVMCFACVESATRNRAPS